MRVLIVTSLVAAFNLIVLPSSAQDPADPWATEKRDPIAGETLYKSGRELLKSGERAAACSKFAASMVLNPRVVTLINLAECSTADGKLLQALVQYKQAAAALPREGLAPERRSGLEELIRKSVAEVEAKLPKLRVVVEKPPAGLEVRRDEQTMLPGMFGELLPVDPGPHLIQATAPGYRVFKELVQLSEGQTRDVAVKIQPRPADGDYAVSTPYDTPTVGATAPAERSGGAAPHGDSPTAAAESPRRVPIWAWVSGGVGLALIGAAIPFKLDSAAAERTLDANCGVNRDACPPEYDPASDNTRKNRSFGLFVGFTVAGAAGVGAGLVGIITAVAGPSRTATKAFDVRPEFSQTMAGATFDARF